MMGVATRFIVIAIFSVRGTASPGSTASSLSSAALSRDASSRPQRDLAGSELSQLGYRAACGGPLTVSGAFRRDRSDAGRSGRGRGRKDPLSALGRREEERENFAKRLTRPTTTALNDTTGDPEAKCYLPGVPRATYIGLPFQIIQTAKQILLSYEFASATRLVYMDRKPRASRQIPWMGWSIGSWDGDTLVIDVTAQNDKTWFDRAGNFHSDALHVVERYTPVSPYHLMYEATIEDPKVFTRPWKIRMPLYRRMEPEIQALEFKCVEFSEEFMYGHLVDKPSN